eukprot:Gb_22237 [translate_table: standard]
MAVAGSLWCVSVIAHEHKPKILSRVPKGSALIFQESGSAANSFQSGFMYLSSAATSICILLTALDASGLDHGGPSIGMHAPLPDSQSLNIAIPIPQADHWGFQNYGSTAPVPGTKKPVKHYGKQTRCPEWNWNEYETVVPDLRGKIKPFPRQTPHWGAHNKTYPSLGSARIAREYVIAYRTYLFRPEREVGPAKPKSTASLKKFDECFRL